MACIDHLSFCRLFIVKVTKVGVLFYLFIYIFTSLQVSNSNGFNTVVCFYTGSSECIWMVTCCKFAVCHCLLFSTCLSVLWLKKFCCLIVMWGWQVHLGEFSLCDLSIEQVFGAVFQWPCVVVLLLFISLCFCLHACLFSDFAQVIVFFFLYE